MTSASQNSQATRWPDYRTVWRWHFYAGLFCMPFIVLLAISGTIYLFKPQIDTWLDQPYDHLSLSGSPKSASAQVQAALRAVPGSTFFAYELSKRRENATRIIVTHHGTRIRVYLHPETLDILKTTPEEDRVMRWVFHFHGDLLMGNGGSALVELAASWTIIMIITGIYLWWPRDKRGFGGVFYPRLTRGSRTFWRDCHAVTGVWIAFFTLFLLITGLPWAKVWGEYFKEVRRLTGTAVVQQDWTVGVTSRDAIQESSEDHRSHGPAASPLPLSPDRPFDYSSLNILIPPVAALRLPHPVYISPPAKAGRYWTAKSDTQNRPQRVTLQLDPSTGTIVGRENFTDRHVLDQAIGIGVAAHEGQLFGWPNVLLGMFTAGGLLFLVFSGAFMWWNRRPTGILGAPPLLSTHSFSPGFTCVLLFFCLYLPLFTASLLAVWFLDFLVLRRLPFMTHWLGLER